MTRTLVLAWAAGIVTGFALAIVVVAGVHAAAPRSAQGAEGLPGQIGAPLDPGVAQHVEHRLKAEVSGANPGSGANDGAPFPRGGSARRALPVVTSSPTFVARSVPRVAPATLRGVASWFAAPTGTAAAGPALRRALGAHWRGKIVETCLSNEPTRCIRVKLTDFCGCPGGRVIDISAGSFARLAPLSAGLVVVRVERA